MISVGGRLRRLLNEHNMNQKELSLLLGVSKQAVSKYVNDQRQMDYRTLIKIANIFNVSIDYIIGKDCETFDKNEGLKIPLIKIDGNKKPKKSFFNLTEEFTLNNGRIWNEKYFLVCFSENTFKLVSFSMVSYRNQYWLLKKTTKFDKEDIVVVYDKEYRIFALKKVFILDSTYVFEGVMNEPSIVLPINDVKEKIVILGRAISLILNM